MDATMYEDGAGRENSFGNKLNSMKRNMTLDFNSTSCGISNSKKQKLQTAVLQSPDLNMLKLASPELEKMIIQANGMVTTTPTPTQILFPKFVTDEQEAYAQGFVAALAELHSKPETGGTDVVSSTNTNISMNDALKNIFTTTTSLPGGIVSSSLPSKSLLNQTSQPMHVTVKEEPQTVPCGLNSPPISPIDMGSQEVIKLERKRARNRIAARKCRTRKLERIARLEDKVSDLKGQNNDLSTQASKLRDEVCKLKKTIIEHVNSGCQIMSQNLNI